MATKYHPQYGFPGEFNGVSATPGVKLFKEILIVNRGYTRRQATAVVNAQRELRKGGFTFESFPKASVCVSLT